MTKAVDGFPIARRVLGDASRLAARFRSARPFPSVVIDGFFEREFAAALAREFPPYDRAKFSNAHGQPGKAAHPDLQRLGGAFARLGRAAAGRPFIRFLETVTGIERLLPDPDLEGGGAQENLPGMGLYPHVDFNALKKRGWHRRLNLLIYLTPGWKRGWGGELTLLKAPRARPTATVAPLFNRAALFATSEASWHAVTAVAPPPGDPRPTRKSVSFYYYTRKRPAGAAPPHSTIWSYPGLPKGVVPGRTLDAKMWAAIAGAIEVRDVERLTYDPAARDFPSLDSRLKPGRRLTADDVLWLRRLITDRDNDLAFRYRFALPALWVHADRIRRRGRR